MQTHSIQFGRHHVHAGSHSHRPLNINGKFAATHAKSSGNKTHDELVSSTQKWVSQTFYGEMLKQMRNSPFKSKLFNGGKDGDTFTEMYDQKLADKMARGSGKKLVDAIVKGIEGNKPNGKRGGTPVDHHSRHQRVHGVVMTGNRGVA